MRNFHIWCAFGSGRYPNAMARNEPSGMVHEKKFSDNDIFSVCSIPRNYVWNFSNAKNVRKSKSRTHLIIRFIGLALRSPAFTVRNLLGYDHKSTSPHTYTEMVNTESHTHTRIKSDGEMHSLRKIQLGWLSRRDAANTEIDLWGFHLFLHSR